MTVRPTRGLIAVVVIAVILNLLTRVTGDAWLALGSAAAIALPLVCLVMRPALPAVSIEVRSPHSTPAGSLLEQQVRVLNNSKASTPPLTWRDACPGLDDVDLLVPSLAPGGAFEATVLRGGPRRGEYDGATATLSTTAPFGVLRYTRVVPSSWRVLVHPRTDRGRALRPDGGHAGELGSTPVAGNGIEILGLRPWRPGDANRAISQRATARHGRPVVLEREREQQVSPALLVIAAGGSAGERWEAQVSSAASLALAALRDGRPVTLMSGAGGPQVPLARDPEGVLDFFASIDRAGAVDGAACIKAASAVHPGGTIVQLRGASFGYLLSPKPGRACCHHEVLDG